MAGMASGDGGGPSAKVVIVGCGSSGLAAATRLLTNGIDDIIILEAQDRIGGRVHYTTSPDGNGVDMGAHWIHGEVGNAVYELAYPLGLVEHSDDYSKPIIFVRPDGSVLPSSPPITKFFNDLYGNKLTEKPQYNSSMAAYVIEDLIRKKDQLGIDENDLLRLESYATKTMCIVEGCGTLSDVSIELSEDYHFCEGDQLNMFKKEGYNNILDLLMRSHKVYGGKDPLPVLEKLKLEERVSSVDWSDKQAVITTEKGVNYAADVVIISVSLAVLKKNNIIFTPPLPKDKQDAINALGIDVVNKIYLFFEEQWWPANCSGYGLLQEPSEANHWGDYISTFSTQKSNPNALVGWIVGDPARAMEADSDDEVLATCQRLLSKFLGPSLQVPPIKGMLRSRWASNKDVAGSYSYQTIAAEKLEKPREALARPLNNPEGFPIVRWAGEATNPQMFSTVHGAVSSGFREADAILKFFNKTERVKVVIVGAGIAGLSAAKTFTESRHTSVAVLEGQNEMGGRIKSEWIGDGWIEFGAQWIHGTDQPLYRLASSFGLLASYSSVEGKGNYFREDGSEIPRRLVEKANDLVESILEDSEKLAFCQDCSQSVGQVVEEQFFRFLQNADMNENEIQMMKDLLQWHMRWQEIDNSCIDLKSMSIDTWGAFCMSAGEKNNNPSDGMYKLVEELAASSGAAVTTGCVVSQINYSGNNIVVRAEDGRIFEADHVLFTGSIAVIKNTPLLFNPPLPHQMIQALEEKGMDLVVKIFLQYEKIWWDASGYQFVWSSNSLTNDWTRYTTGVETVDGREDTLLAWVGSLGAAVVESLDEFQIGLHITNVLRKFTNRSDIPVPNNVFKSTWGKNKFIQGAYSYLKNSRIESGQLVHEVLAKPVTKTLSNGKVLSVSLGGEAVHKELYSTLQGAYLSGQDQANRIIKMIEWNDSFGKTIRN